VHYALKHINGVLEVGPTKTHAKRRLTVPTPLVPALRALLEAPGVRHRGVKRGQPRGYPYIKQTDTGPALDWTEDAQDTNRLLFTTPNGHPPDLQAVYSAPGRIRTCDPRLRRPSLYPAELRGPRLRNSSAAPRHKGTAVVI
jgi:hypothetical protein